MSWALLWIFSFLALYLLLGPQRLAVILMSMICGALVVQPFLGQTGILVGGLIGFGAGLLLVYVRHNRVVAVRHPAV